MSKMLRKTQLLLPMSSYDRVWGGKTRSTYSCSPHPGFDKFKKGFIKFINELGLKMTKKRAKKGNSQESV